MVTALDDAVANVTAALRRTGLYRDSIIVFLSDNGGAERGSNWPLRGKKNSVYEGGTRTVAFVHSPRFIPKTTTSRRGDNSHKDGDDSGNIASGLVHIVDWYPTLLALAANRGHNSGNSGNSDESEDYKNDLDVGDDEDLQPLDGVNQARHLLGDAPAPRTELIYNINDALRVTAAIRHGENLRSIDFLYWIFDISFVAFSPLSLVYSFSSESPLQQCTCFHKLIVL